MRRAVLEAHARLVEAMFLCEVSSTAEVLSGADMEAAILAIARTETETLHVCIKF